ncbi:MAG: PQQ-binding-like beta-propeller repeat protein [Candidatus Latescibacteria bacterium]|nr:PQQ-binding-like beta-propeller repeat protein [Candidatus Latescibacterota bacterium]
MALRKAKPMTSANRRPSVRWWPAAVLALLLVAALLAIWLPDSTNRQNQYIQTAAAALLAGLLGLVWLVAFSRLVWYWRLGPLVAGALLMVGLGSQLHIVGFTGDMLPILSFRPNPDDAFLKAPAQTKTTAQGPYSQFLGPNRNAVVPGYRLDPDWNGAPPTLLWKRSVGQAWSAFAIVGDRALTQEQDGPLENVVCYDLGSGEILWTHSDSTRYESAQGGIGPRATPTIDGDRVFTLGATGLLNALHLETGAPLWQHDIIAEHDAVTPHWGLSGSPLVLDSLVVVSPGGPADRSLVAYHRDNGAFVWGGGQTQAGYSSPSLAVLADTPQILIFNSSTLAGHNPATGTLLWEVD